jgi:MFS family permease
VTPLAYLRGLRPGLPRSVQVLQLGSLVNALGNGFVLPFLFIYLTDVRGIDKAAAGLVLGTNALVSLLVGPAAGALAERIGARRTLMASLVTAAAGYGAYALVHTAWQAFLVAAVTGVANGSFWPAQSSLIAQLTPHEASHAAWSMQRVTANIGIGIGGIVGGFLAHGTGAHGYQLLFLLDAATFVTYLGVASTLPDPRRRPKAGERAGTYRDVLRNGILVRVLLLNSVWVAAGLALIELMPAYMKHESGLSPRQIGLVFLANTLFIGLLQLPVTQILEGTRRVPTYALVLVVGAAAWLCVPVAGHLAAGGSATAAFAAIAVVFGLAECLHGAVQGPLVVDLAEPRLIERTMALSASSWAIGFIVGPAIGAAALKASPTGLWIGAGAILVASAFGALRLERQLPVHALRTPLRDRADQLAAAETFAG